MTNDEDWLRMAIDVGNAAKRSNELPFGALIVSHNGELLASGQQRIKRDHDPSHHAELMALQLALRQSHNGHSRLTGCTLYSTVEPCAMCAMFARQYQIGRVVFGLRSPLLGGYTHWPILQDDNINAELPFMGLAFAAPPTVLADVCAHEVLGQWYRWNQPLAAAMESSGIFSR
jgi:tRNA(adenine34) deaminase